MKHVLLVIDDDENMLSLIESMCRKSLPDIRIITAQTGRRGLQLARSEHPGVVVLDVKLPDIDGFEVCRRIRVDPATINTRILMISGVMMEPKDRVRGIEGGADNYLHKPFEQEELVLQLQALFRWWDAEQAQLGKMEGLVARRTKALAEANAGLQKEIVERQRAEHHIRHLNEVLRAGRQIGQLIHTEKDPHQLLNKACQTLVQTRGYVTVWIGRPEPGSKYVTPVAHAGAGGDFLQHAVITWDDSPSGRGPAGTAIRERRPAVVDDAATDPNFAPWRGPVTAAGAASLASVPLLHGERLFGALTVKADQARFFNADEIMLLSTLASDLALALQSIEDEQHRRQAEERAADALNFAEKILESSPIGMMTFRASGQCVSANEAAAAIVGGTVAQVLQQNFRQIGSWAQFGLLAAAEQALASGLEQRLEAHVTTSLGREVWLACRFVPFRHQDEPHLLLMASDVSARKRAEAENHRLAQAVEQAAETIVITDVHGTILYTNPAFEKTTGYTRQEALGQNPRMLKSGSQDAAFYRQLWATLQRGEIWHGHFINRRKDGVYYEEEATISPVRDAAGVIANFVAVKHDVTREVQLEQQVQQAQKMESVGRLAGGVAHDFNNILQAILGYVEVLLEAMPASDKRHGDLLEIQKAGQRAADLTRQLLAFSRKQMITLVPLNLNTVVGDTQKMLQRLVGATIQMDTSLAPNLPYVRADAGQLQQIIMNLTVNARDAMPAGGRLSLSTTSVTFDEHDVHGMADARPGRFVCLAVTDTGVGMSKDVMAHIFEPFFSTKGLGTGLGLSVIYGIAQQHQGWIHVYSQEGQGSTFKLYLPAYIEDLGASGPYPATAAPPRGQGECILLIEDDGVVRNLAVQVLRAAGYEVLVASTSAEGCAWFAREQHRLDLLISDVVLPDRDGIATAEQLRQQRPDLAVLLCSGYVDERARWSAIENHHFHFLQKPFPSTALLRAVHDLLAARRPGRAAPGGPTGSAGGSA